MNSSWWNVPQAIAWDNSTAAPRPDSRSKLQPLPDKFVKTVPSKTLSAARDRVELQKLVYTQLLAQPKALTPIPASTIKARNDEPDPEVVWDKAKQRVSRLWDELLVDHVHRDHIRAACFAGGPSVQNIQVLDEEIRRLLQLRERRAAIAAAIEAREGFVYLLQEAVERTDGSPALDREVVKRVNSVRTASFAVLDAVRAWWEVLGCEEPYLWRGVSYLWKMNMDLLFLATCPMRLPFEVNQNPLLDPDKATPGYVGRKSSSTFSPQQYESGARMLLSAAVAEKNSSHNVTSFVSAHTPVADAHVIASLSDCVVNEKDLLSQFLPAKRAVSDADTKARIAATRIQSVFRGFLTRKSAGTLEREHRAAVRIQCWFRRLVAKSKVALARKRCIAAAKIQAVQRGTVIRQRWDARTLRVNSATRIQAAFRGFMVRNRTNLLRALHRAVTKIQAVFRGWCLRKRYFATVRGLQGEAATDIQRVWRGRKLRRSDPRRNRAATKIQALVRGWIARRHAAFLRGVRDAALKIQAANKGYLTRKTSVRHLHGPSSSDPE